MYLGHIGAAVHGYSVPLKECKENSGTGSEAVLLHWILRPNQRTVFSRDTLQSLEVKTVMIKTAVYV